MATAILFRHKAISVIVMVVCVIEYGTRELYLVANILVYFSINFHRTLMGSVGKCEISAVSKQRHYFIAF